MRTLIVDRFENTYLLCEDEDRRLFAIESKELPEGVQGGDVLRISDEGVIAIDQKETAARRSRIKQEKRFR